MKQKTPRGPAFGPLLERAVELRRTGDPAGAAALCRSILASDARNVPALHLLGTLALEAGDPSTAIGHLAAAARADARDPFVLVDLARAHAAAGSGDEARRTLDKAVSLARGQAGVIAAAAGALETLGDLDQAEALYRRAASLAPNVPDLWLGLGNVQARQGRPDDAEASYRRVQTLHADHPGLAGSLGNLLKSRGDVAGAEVQYRRALATNPADPVAHYNLGLLLFDSGRGEEAVRHFAEAVRLQPTHARALCQLAAITGDSGRFVEAEDMYRRIVEAAPGCMDAVFGRGMALIALDRTPEAVAWFERFTGEFPAEPLPHSGLGSAHMMLGRLTDAEHAFRAAARLDPASEFALQDLLDCLWLNGPEAEAEAEALEAQMIARDAATWRRHLGRLHFQRLRFSRARAHYEALRTLDPDSAEPIAHLGEIDLFQGRFDRHAWAASNEWVRRTRGADGPATVSLPDPARPGEKLLVEWEQGIGDELFYLRFVPGLAALGAQVVYRAGSKLHPLLRRHPGALAGVIGPAENAPPAARRVKVTDLPCIAPEIPSPADAPVPWPLAALPERVEGMRTRLASLGPPPYLGVTWRAGTTETSVALISRNVRLLKKRVDTRALGDTLRGVRGTVLVLQRLPEPEETQAFRLGLGREAHDLSWINDDLEDALALLAVLDDYVGVSNTNMHLRAGLGRSARVLVPRPPPWRWMAEGDTSPWFPGFRVYRPDALDGWTDAFARLRQDLQTALGAFETFGSADRRGGTGTSATPPPAGASARAVGVGEQPSALISPEYRRMQEDLHRDPNYGRASVEFAPTVAAFVKAHGIGELLDYGAGKGRLGQELVKLMPTPPTIRHYDPGVPAWSAPAAPTEMVASIDVLEHIEPDLLPNVLDDLARVTRRFGLFTIATGPARKVLADGRNAHLIQQPPDWWLPQLMQRFDLVHFSLITRGFLVVVAPKAGRPAA